MKINFTKIQNLTEEKNLTDNVVKYILDEDYDVIEKALLGLPAIDCLPLHPENSVAPPQGTPFLRLAQPINAILRRYKGIYSI